MVLLTFVNEKHNDKLKIKINQNGKKIYRKIEIYKNGKNYVFFFSLSTKKTPKIPINTEYITGNIEHSDKSYGTYPYCNPKISDNQLFSHKFYTLKM